MTKNPAPWLDGDVAATAAYLRKAVANETDTLHRQHVMRVIALTAIDAIHRLQGSKFTDAETTRLTIAVLDALEQAFGGKA